jgi:hypothetical protein
MMKTQIILTLPLLILVACNRPSSQVSEETPAGTPPPLPAMFPHPTVPPAASAPQIAAATPAATPEPPQPAPPGVFYLLRAARVETDSGITGLPPGTGVKLLHDDVYQTPAGDAKLDPAQLTNDMALARRVLAEDRKQQTALQSKLAAEAAQAHAQEVARNAQQGQTLATQTAAMDQAARNARLADLNTARQSLVNQLSALNDKRGGELYRQNHMGRIVTSTTGDQIKAVSDQIAAVDAEIGRLSQQQ